MLDKLSFNGTLAQLAENKHFPGEQATTALVPALAPNKALKKPKTQISLREKDSKSTSPPKLRLLALETIDSYHNINIKAFTDSSAVRAVRNGGYGSVIMIPSKEEPTLLSGPCGSYCSNYEAEIIAIRKTLNTIIRQFESDSSTPRDTVIFSVSISAIQQLPWQCCKGH